MSSQHRFLPAVCLVHLGLVPCNTSKQHPCLHFRTLHVSKYKSHPSLDRKQWFFAISQTEAEPFSIPNCYLNLKKSNLYLSAKSCPTRVSSLPWSAESRLDHIPTAKDRVIWQIEMLRGILANKTNHLVSEAAFLLSQYLMLHACKCKSIKSMPCLKLWAPRNASQCYDMLLHYCTAWMMIANLIKPPWLLTGGVDCDPSLSEEIAKALVGWNNGKWEPGKNQHNTPNTHNEICVRLGL